ncbi:MAG: membrane protein [Phycisphaerae bacterium]|nr:MAG: membrane protein [Phycisphaerae bacterium]
MHSWIDAIFGLEQFSAGAKDVSWSLVHPLPGWVWALVVLASFTLAWMTYGRLLGPRPARVALASLRGLLLVLLVLLICQPHLVRQTVRVEPDCVAVLIDRSASMTIADATLNGVRATREQQLQAAMRRAAPTLESLAKTRGVVTLGFDAGAFDLPTATDGLPTLGEPTGRRTAIGHTLDLVLRRVAARPLAGIVLLSDGRSADAVSRLTLRQLETRGVPVFAVPLGSPDPIPDLAIARIDAPSAAFAGDAVPVTVAIDRRGGGSTPSRGRVRLLDTASGLTLDELPFTLEADAGTVTLTTIPDQAATRTWSVQIIPELPDLSDQNNAASVRIDVVDRPIRVVMFDGYPRWEYRYLKNLLVREPSVRSSTLILASDRRYLQEGTEPLASVPRTAAAWAAIDVVILGDLRPSLFSEDQLRQVRALVSERGAGLLWVGGPSATPNAWRGTPLGDLLPFVVPTDPAEAIPAYDTPVVMRPGPAAERFGVLRLGEARQPTWPDMLSTGELGWPKLHYAQRIDPRALKPTADVLALAQPIAGAPSGATPLVLTMRYGAGRVAYVGTDETWRYRYGRGETLPERFWIPLVRLLARESFSRSGKPAILAVSPERALEGQPVLLTLRLIDQTLLERQAPTLTVTIRRAEVAEPTTPIEVTLHAEGDAIDAPGTGMYSTVWVPPDVGRYVIESAEPFLAGLDLAAGLEISLPDDELLMPQADHAYLASLAQATGGQVLTMERLVELPTLLPNREVTLLGTPEIETIWDKPAVWVLLMLLVATEWLGRRLIKLA